MSSDWDFEVHLFHGTEQIAFHQNDLPPQVIKGLEIKYAYASLVSDGVKSGVAARALRINNYEQILEFNAMDQPAGYVPTAAFLKSFDEF